MTHRLPRVIDRRRELGEQRLGQLEPRPLWHPFEERTKAARVLFERSARLVDVPLAQSGLDQVLDHAWNSKC
jgi:hypothetical protein